MALRSRNRRRGGGGGRGGGRPAWPSLSPADALAWMLFTIDAALVAMARGGGAIDLAIGETLVELEKGDRLIELGFSQLKDYLHGLAGLPPSTYYFYLDLADALSDRPLLRRAVVRGLVTPRKALLVAPLAEGSAEAAWAAAAREMTEKELRLRVETVGIAPELDSFETESFETAMTVAEQAILDEAITAAKWVLGMDKPRWMCLQAIATEWLSGFAEHVSEPVFPKGAPEVSAADAARLRERWYQELSARGRALEEQLLTIDDALDPGRGLAEEMDGLNPNFSPARAVLAGQRTRSLRRRPAPDPFRVEAGPPP